MSRRSAVFFLLLGGLCGSCAKPEPRAASVRTVAAPDNRLSYDVTASPGGAILGVEANFPPSSRRLFIDPETRGYLRDLEVSRGGSYEPGDLSELDCPAGCRVRYRFRLGEAAGDIDDFDIAGRAGNTLIAPASSWLLRPEPAKKDLDYALRIEAPSGTRFVTGATSSKDGTFSGLARYLDDPPYTAFGTLGLEHVKQPGGELEIAFADSGVSVERSKVVAWLSSAASAINRYFGRFPVERALVLVVPQEGRRVHGKQLGVGGSSVLFIVGKDVERDVLSHDWKAVHELVHVATPSLSRRHMWLMEGLATYVEPLARAQDGQLSETRVWRDLISGMPKGLPEAGDEGLDNTHTWGRTYWGGALFCLSADVEIRKQSGGRQSLQSALRGIRERGGTTEQQWSMEEFVRVGDEVTGQNVLRDLYAAQGQRSGKVDLAKLFADLGVSLDGGQVRFDDAAPLAEIRRALTRAMD